MGGGPQRIAIVMGTRPHVGKVFPLQRALRAAGAEVTLLHTNQHHDPELHGQLFRELGYRPDATMSAYRLGAAIDWLQDELRRCRATVVVVQGDSVPALLGAVAGEYLDLPVAHVEAGLRSGDHRMKEEVNRIAVDGLSHWLFAYCDRHAEQLHATPHLRGEIHVVGNPTADLVRLVGPQLGPATPSGRCYLTLHRRELTDDPEALGDVLAAVGKGARKLGAPVTFPVHPRTRAALEEADIDPGALLGPGARVVEPVTTLASLAAIAAATAVITDSGCVQEEACILGTPCVTARDHTERHETIAVGANVLAGTDPASLATAIGEVPDRPARWSHPYGDGRAAHRVAEVLVRA